MASPRLAAKPAIIGSEGEKAVDIAQLRGKTGCVPLDPAFMKAN
jgi:hypothetical protein